MMAVVGFLATWCRNGQFMLGGGLLRPAPFLGAAFDIRGKLWVSASTNRFGFLYKLDPYTGQVTSRYEMVIGMEGIAFDNVGHLWSVSEAGSLRWQRWGTTFPVLCRLDLDKVKPSP